MVYLTAEGGRYKSAIGGIVRFTGERREVQGSSSLFDALYTLKASFEEVVRTSEPVPFEPLIGKVSFVGSGKNWGGYLQGQPIKPITEKDFKTIRDGIMESNG